MWEVKVTRQDGDSENYVDIDEPRFTDRAIRFYEKTKDAEVWIEVFKTEAEAIEYTEGFWEI